MGYIYIYSPIRYLDLSGNSVEFTLVMTMLRGNMRFSTRTVGHAVAMSTKQVCHRLLHLPSGKLT